MAAEQYWRSPAVRLAIQAALGAGLSILCGSMVSGRRWYWAAIAAFIVGMGVGSRGEALTKALQRVIGTICGIVVGIFLAAGVAGHTDLTLGLLLVIVFFAFYAFQAAYGLMIFGITLMIALLYGMLGMFQPGLLVLRLEETAIGAAIGVLVTYFVLPTRDAAAFRAAASAFLQALCGMLTDGRGDGADALAATREMQAKAQAMRTAIGPLKRGWGNLAPMRYRRAVHSGMYCAYLAREFVNRGAGDTGQTAALLAEIRCVHAAIDATARQDEPVSNPARSPDAPTDEPALARALHDALRRFGERMREI